MLPVKTTFSIVDRAAIKGDGGVVSRGVCECARGVCDLHLCFRYRGLGQTLEPQTQSPAWLGPPARSLCFPHWLPPASSVTWAGRLSLPWQGQRGGPARGPWPQAAHPELAKDSLSWVAAALPGRGRRSPALPS